MITKFYNLVGDNTAKNVSDMTSLAASNDCKMYLNCALKCKKRVQLAKSQINRSRFDASSPLMTHRMSAEIYKLSGVAFRLAPPIGGLLGNLQCFQK